MLSNHLYGTDRFLNDYMHAFDSNERCWDNEMNSSRQGGTDDSAVLTVCEGSTKHVSLLL